MISKRRGRGGHALLAGVELGAQPPQRQVRLGRQDQGEEADLQRHLADRQPEADPTATRATEIVASSSSTSAERKATRSVAHRLDAVGVGDPAQDRDLGVGPPVGAQRRQAGDDVEEAVRQARRGPPSAARRRALRHPPDEDHEHRDQRHGQQHRQRGDRRRPRPGRRRPTAGTIAASASCGQVPREVAVERVEAAGREQRRPRRCAPPTPSAARAPRPARAAGRAGPTSRRR